MRVAVLGAGYAGLTVARRLERRLLEDVELVVVDEPVELVLDEMLVGLVDDDQLGVLGKAAFESTGDGQEIGRAHV